MEAKLISVTLDSVHRFAIARQKSTDVAHIADPYASDAPCNATEARRPWCSCDKQYWIVDPIAIQYIFTKFKQSV